MRRTNNNTDNPTTGLPLDTDASNDQPTNAETQNAETTGDNANTDATVQTVPTDADNGGGNRPVRRIETFVPKDDVEGRKKGHANNLLLQLALAGYVRYIDGVPGLAVLHDKADEGVNDAFVPLAGIVGITESAVERVKKETDPKAKAETALKALIEKGYTKDDLLAFAASMGLE